MELDLWTQSLVTAMTALWTKVANFIPNLFGALVLVLLGFVVAKLLDTLLSIPSLLLAIIMVAILGPGLFNTLIAITLALIPPFIRATYNAVHT
ncbi:mechanosensitive ion channel family protein, partial [Escherichia coli]